MAQNPYSQYQEQSMMTMTSGELLQKVYSGLIKFLTMSVNYIDEGNYQGANLCLQKSQNILNYLRAQLDHQVAISAQLDDLYSFFYQQCVQANMRKDKSYIEPIIEMISSLSETYAKADKIARQNGR